LTGIQAGDLFFVDSTHAVRPGSEVNRIIPEALRVCRLDPQYISRHLLPYDYQPSLMTSFSSPAKVRCFMRSWSITNDIQSASR